MTSNYPTSVNLTETAQSVRDNLSCVYGLKNCLSAGLILFGRLSPAEQQAVIREANGLPGPAQAAKEGENDVARAAKERKRNPIANKSIAK